MALLRRELYRQVKGPKVTHADCCTLVFDTDAKNLYVEREVADLNVSVDSAIEIQTATITSSKAVKLPVTANCGGCLGRCSKRPAIPTN
jgi:hypothetical protein